MRTLRLYTLQLALALALVLNCGAARSVDSPAHRGTDSALMFRPRVLQSAPAEFDNVPNPLVRAVPTADSAVTEPDRPLSPATGAVCTEALDAMGATAWHEAGHLGQGIRVGVIDLGFGLYQTLLDTELPEHVATRNFVDGQEGTSVGTGTPHGTAVAEIIHDVAPGAALYLAKILTPADLVEAVDWLLDEDVQVINTSITWFDVAPGDGTGLIADQVARARAAGTLWVSASGDCRQRHWCGDWDDPQAGNVLRFGPDDRFNLLYTDDGYDIPAGTMIQATLRWSDWEVVDQDYDLYLYETDPDGTVWHVVASSTNPQTGLYGQQPTESLGFATISPEGCYGLVIRAHSATHDIHLDLFVDGETRLRFSSAAQSLSNLADAAGVLSVGAASWRSPYAVLPDSSAGPTKGPGGVAEGGLAQPGLVAYGDVSTASAGILNGSEAAAPHVAGAAALILGRSPDWGPEAVEAFLFEHARDNLPPAGWDPTYGHGSLYLGSPVPLTARVWLPLVMR